MNSPSRRIISSAWIRLALLLVLVYAGQVYPYYHLHHFHDGELPAHQASSHSVRIAVENLAEHSYHDGERDEGDHQPSHQQALHQGQVAWHLNRIQSSRTYRAIDQSVFSSGPVLIFDLGRSCFADHIDAPFVGDYHARYRMFRGPPADTFLT